MIGPRASLSWAPGVRPPLLLNPRVDDRATYRHVYTLDPARGYWPVEGHLESKKADGSWRTVDRTRVVDFHERAGWIVPKRVSKWNPGGTTPETRRRESSYLMVVEVEFPDRIDDALLRVAIPDGARVHDQQSGKTRVQGQPDPPAAPLLPAETDRRPLARWLVNFGLLLMGVLWASAARHFLVRGRPGRPGTGA